MPQNRQFLFPYDALWHRKSYVYVAVMVIISLSQMKKQKFYASLNLTHQNLNTTNVLFKWYKLQPILCQTFVWKFIQKLFRSIYFWNSVMVYDYFVLLCNWHDSFIQKNSISSKLMLISTIVYHLSLKSVCSSQYNSICCLL